MPPIIKFALNQSFDNTMSPAFVSMDVSLPSEDDVEEAKQPMHHTQMAQPYQSHAQILGYGIQHIPPPKSFRALQSLPQSHTYEQTPTPMTYRLSTSESALSNDGQHSVVPPASQSRHVHKFSVPNQVPFIQEDLSTHSVNSVSSYPSILALKLSFTNQASNDAISLLSPTVPPHLRTQPMNANHEHNVLHANQKKKKKKKADRESAEQQTKNEKQSNNLCTDSNASGNLDDDDDDDDETVEHVAMSSDSSFYNNEPDRDRAVEQHVQTNISPNSHDHNNDEILSMNRQLSASSRSRISKRNKISLKTPQTMSQASKSKIGKLEKEKLSAQNSSNSGSSLSSNNNHSKLKLTPKESSKTRSVISPQTATATAAMNSNIRLLSATDVSSLLDHEDQFDPPQPSLHFSVVSTPTAVHAHYASRSKSKNTQMIAQSHTAPARDGDVVTPIILTNTDHLNVNGNVNTAEMANSNELPSPHIAKIPGNGQYAQYAAMKYLESVVEEVSEQSSLDNDMKTDRKNDNNDSDEMQMQMQRNPSKPVPNQNDASIEYHAYKRRPMKHNANGVNMSGGANVIVQKHSHSHNSARSTTPSSSSLTHKGSNTKHDGSNKSKKKQHVQLQPQHSSNSGKKKKSNIKRKKAFYHDSQAANGHGNKHTASVIITSKRNNRYSNNSKSRKQTVDIRRPKTSRIARVSSNQHNPRLRASNSSSDRSNSRPRNTYRQDDVRLFRYPLESSTALIDTPSSSETSSFSASITRCSTTNHTDPMDDEQKHNNAAAKKESHHNGNNKKQKKLEVNIAMERSSTFDVPPQYAPCHSSPYQPRYINVTQPYYRNQQNPADLRLYNNHQQRQPNQHQQQQPLRRPVPIIRRGRPQSMTRASSSISYEMHMKQSRHHHHHHHHKHNQNQDPNVPSPVAKKYGLFDESTPSVTATTSKYEKSLQQQQPEQSTPSGPPAKGVKYRHQAVPTSDLSEWEYMERDKFFLQSKYKSYDETDVSLGREQEHSTTNGFNIDEKLSGDNNVDHAVCKKEIHDAYERGFLAGYFLGVNIMQQQQKENDVQSQSVAMLH